MNGVALAGDTCIRVESERLFVCGAHKGTGDRCRQSSPPSGQEKSVFGLGRQEGTRGGELVLVKKW